MFFIFYIIIRRPTGQPAISSHTERQLPRPVMQEQGAARVESISNSIGEHWTLHSIWHCCICMLAARSSSSRLIAHPFLTPPLPHAQHVYLLLSVHQACLTHKIYYNIKVQGGQQLTKLLFWRNNFLLELKCLNWNIVKYWWATINLPNCPFFR